MLCYYTMSQCQAYAVTLCFSGEEGNEDALQIDNGNSFAVVFNLDHRPFLCIEISFLATGNMDQTFGLFLGYGFGGVAQKVQ